jgi:hypothetical protein
MNLPKSGDVDTFADDKMQTRMTVLTEKTLDLVPASLRNEMETKYQQFITEAGDQKKTIGLAQGDNLVLSHDNKWVCAVKRKSPSSRRASPREG